MAWPLVLAGLAMGVAATPHCAVMCGAPCAALTGGSGRSATGFALGRLLGYAAAGAVAAGSVAALGAWSQAAPALRPLWTLLHLGLLALGLWWLATGRPVDWMQRGGAVPVSLPGRPARPLRAGLAGLAWVAWPCVALQAALLLAALANGPAGGAMVMAAFALGSMPGLALAPWAWSRWRAWRGRSAALAGAPRAPRAPRAPHAPHAPAWDAAGLGLRVAGGGLVLASGWALTHGIWRQLAAWCFGG
jgi:sulfite exporter TauE/SafE